jgi:hypothetical protein
VTKRHLFGVRRLDAALVSGGLTPLNAIQTYSLVEASEVIRISILAQESGVKPPHSKKLAHLIRGSFGDFA